MPTTPWAVQRTKRKQPSTTPAPRKRARISDDVGGKRSTSARSKNQKTLTQIQWVNSPNISPDDGLDLREISLEGMEQRRAPQPKRRKLSKRDSTLTQMEWLGETLNPEDEVSNDLNELKGGNENEVENQLPQLDGSFDVKKKKKRKSMPAPEPLLSSSPTSMERETQDYLPNKKRKKNQPQSPQSTNPQRKSKRIASKMFPDPQVNVQHLGQTLIPQSSHKPAPQPKPRPQLEIKDTYESEDEETPTQIRIQPHTPQRTREIPSSQTPETLTRITRSKTKQQAIHKSPSKVLKRKPLGERSVNLPSTPHLRGLKSFNQETERSKPPSMRGNICVLKVPSRDLLQRLSNVEKPQQDIYSLPATSSDEGNKLSSRSPDPEVEGRADERPQESIEIPSTTQRNSDSEHNLPSSPPDLGVGASLPELSELIPSRRERPPTGSHKQSNRSKLPSQSVGDDSINVHNFGRPHLQDKNPSQNVRHELQHVPDIGDNDVMLLDQEPENDKSVMPLPAMTNELSEKDDDDGSEFGSPVANDTQFNARLLERTSSPNIMTQRDNVGGAAKNGVFVPSTNTRGNIINAEMGTELPMPIPKLVAHPTSSTTQVRFNVASQDEVAVNLPSNHVQESYTSITRVPLNDTAEPATLSLLSSPPLPPFRSFTQQSIRPAAMPRPSQVSTQEPTQAFPFSSMRNSTQHYNDQERITIKDSSSINLSQIPHHATQGQSLHLQTVDETDDEIDDLDLDPSSAQQGRQSARKLTGLERKETGSSLRSLRPLSALQKVETSSSLRSIHLSSDGPSDKDAELVPSSSPSLRADKPQDEEMTRRDNNKTPTQHRPEATRDRSKKHEIEDDPDLTSSPISSPTPAPLKRKYNPIPGFDNETQSNFTQNGHVTAAYVHRQRETGAWPDWFVPEPFQLTGRKGSRKLK